MDKKEQTRIRVQRYRDKQKSVTQDKDVTQECNARNTDGTPYIVGASGVSSAETVPASCVQGITGKFEVLPERPRYLDLTDDQVLDRANQSEGHTSGDRIQRMQACNEASYNFHPRKKKVT